MNECMKFFTAQSFLRNKQEVNEDEEENIMPAIPQ